VSLEAVQGPWYASRLRMRVHLRPQQRTVELAGRRTVGRLLAELDILPGTAMVIRGDLLLTDGETVEDGDEIEIRAVISGGST
jgi:sulfur carrier protein ThiS